MRRMHPSRITYAVLVTTWLIAPALRAAAEKPSPPTMTAGVSVVDITPPEGMRMCGYFHERINTGTHDPLHARALVLTQGREHAALVFCDLISISPDVSRRARNAAERSTGIPASNVVVAATHSHTGPLYYGAMRQHLHDKAVARHGRDPAEPVDYAALLVERIVGAIEKAWQTREPVILEAGRGQETRLSFNRRFHMKDGTVRFNPGQQNPNVVRPAGPIDPDIGLLVVRQAQTLEPVAVLTVFALHLDTTGGTKYAADYPYYLQQKLQGALGADLVSLFGIGTCGDINHIDVSIKERRSSEKIGTLLGETVLKSLKSLERIDRPSLAVARERLELPMQRYDEKQTAQAARNMDKIGTGELAFLQQVEAYKIMAVRHRGGTTLPAEVQVFRLGQDTAIVTLPGEVFVDLGLAIKEASPFKNTLVIELANDGPGYIPTKKAFAEGSYETVNSRIQPGGGERLVETAIGLLEGAAADDG